MTRTTRTAGLMRGLAALLAFSGGIGTGQAGPPAVTGAAFTHTVVRGESWHALGSRHGVDPALLAADNGATLQTPVRPGTVLSIDNRHIVPDVPDAGIVINVPQRMLFVRAAGQMVASYPVGLGRPDSPTFVGAFTVDRMEADPVWDVPPSIQEELRRAGKKVVTRTPPGPANPLGKYWLGLSEPNFGIHGTIAPRSIYRFESHGCIRLHPDDVADLWSRVRVGTTGIIVYEPILMTMTENGAVLIEAHRDVYRREPRADEVVRTRAQESGVEDRLNWEAVTAALAAREGRPQVVSRQPSAISRKPSAISRQPSAISRQP